MKNKITDISGKSPEFVTHMVNKYIYRYTMDEVWAIYQQLNPCYVLILTENAPMHEGEGDF